jgi:hypothetical protein
LRLFLAWTGFDLTQAGKGLIGLSNSLHLQDGSRAVQTNWVQKGLKLPRDHTDDLLKTVVKVMERRG